MSIRGFVSLGVLMISLIVAQAAADVRIAVVAIADTDRGPADFLTAALSREPGIVLLERNEVDRVLREQALTAGQRIDYIQVGHILGADGLVLMQSFGPPTNNTLGLRFVAVKSGVVLTAMSTRLPINEPDQWAKVVASRFTPFTPKFGVSRDRAIPISLLNIHGPLATQEASETERELNMLLLLRLAREQDLFVLERRQMDSLQLEKDFSGPDDQQFWAGSYLLDGVVQDDGATNGLVTVRARLVPPNGAEPAILDVSGLRSEPAAIVEQIDAKVMAALKREKSATNWDRDKEAAEFQNEARWAARWGMWSEAASAAESAWVLGDHALDTVMLRVNALVHEADTDENLGVDFETGRLQHPNDPDPQALLSAMAALEFYISYCNSTDPRIWQTNHAWLDLGLVTLRGSSLVLRHFYHYGLRSGDFNAHLADLRAATRQLVSLLPPDAHRLSLTEITEPSRFYSGIPSPEYCDSLEAASGIFGEYWQDTPAAAVDLYRRMMSSGAYARERLDIVNRNWENPFWVGWTATDRTEGPRIWQNFIAELMESSNRTARADGALLKLSDASTDAEWEAAYNAFITVSMDSGGMRFLPDTGCQVVDAFDMLLRRKYQVAVDHTLNVPPERSGILASYPALISPDSAQRRGQLLARWKTTRFARVKLYLQTTDQFDQSRGDLDLRSAWFSQEQARELLPVAEDYARRFPAQDLRVMLQHIRESTTNAPDQFAEFFDDPDFDSARFQKLFGDHEFTPAEAVRILPAMRHYMSLHPLGPSMEMSPLYSKLKNLAAQPSKPASKPEVRKPQFVPNEMWSTQPASTGQIVTHPLTFFNFRLVGERFFGYRIGGCPPEKMSSGSMIVISNCCELWTADLSGEHEKELVGGITMLGTMETPPFDVLEDDVVWVDLENWYLGRINWRTGATQQYPVNLPHDVNMRVQTVANRLFVFSGDFIAEFKPREGTLTVLASRRRSPAITRLDADHWPGFPSLQASGDGKLVASFGSATNWIYEDHDNDWRPFVPASLNIASPVSSNLLQITSWPRPFDQRLNRLLQNVSPLQWTNNFGTNYWYWIDPGTVTPPLAPEYELVWFDPRWEMPIEVPIALPNTPIKRASVSFNDGKLEIVPRVSLNGNFLALVRLQELGAWVDQNHPANQNIPRREPELLQMYDLNKDGVLDKAELATMRHNPRFQEEDANVQSRRLLLTFDADGDGKLEGEELTNLLQNCEIAVERVPLARRRQPRQSISKPTLRSAYQTVSELMARFDANHDEALDQNELKALYLTSIAPPDISEGNTNSPTTIK